MIRLLFWIMLWVLTLGFGKFHVEYSDGLTIDLKPLWGKLKEKS